MKDKKKRKEILNKIASPKQIKMLKFIKDKCDVKFKGKQLKNYMTLLVNGTQEL